MVSRLSGNFGKQVTENEETVGSYRNIYTFLRVKYPYVLDTAFGGDSVCSSFASYCRRYLLHSFRSLTVPCGGMAMKIIVLKAPKIIAPLIRWFAGISGKQ